MRVIVDAVSIESGGGRRYVQGLLPALATSRTDWHFLILARRGVPCGVDGATNVSVIRLPGIMCKFPLRLITQQSGIPLLGWFSRANIVLSLADIGPIWSPIPVVATVANAFVYRAFSKSPVLKLSKVDLPLVDRLRTRGLGLISALFLRSAKGLVFWTAASRAEVESLKGKQFKSIVCHNGEPYAAGDHKVPMARKKQLVCVSSVVRYRNQLRLIRAFQQLLTDDSRCADFSLVLIGDLCDTQYVSSIRSFLSANSLEEKVHLRGNVSHTEVRKHYDESWGLVFPSRVETYGFPIVEGLFSEIPMCVSDISPFRELAGRAAIYFDPTSVASIKDSLQCLICNEPQRQELIQEAREQRLRYSWVTAASRITRILEEVLDVNGSTGFSSRLEPSRRFR